VGAREQEKKRVKIAVESTLKYGICEYETMKIINESRKGKIFAYLSLFRPIVGLFPMLLVTIRVYGFKEGIAEAFKRQYLKAWFRWEVLRNVKYLDVKPDPCKVIGKQ
jgi:hypothetical protein